MLNKLLSQKVLPWIRGCEGADDLENLKRTSREFSSNEAPAMPSASTVKIIVFLMVFIIATTLAYKFHLLEP